MKFWMASSVVAVFWTITSAAQEFHSAQRTSPSAFFASVSPSTSASAPQQGVGSEAPAVRSHQEKAAEFLREKKPLLAIPEFEAIVAAEPKNIDGQANLGVLLYFSGQFGKAELHLRAALTINPELSRVQALLGFAEHRTGNLESARTDLAAALPGLDDPKVRRQAGLELVEVDTARGDLPGAAVAIDQLQAALPTDPEVLYAAYRVHTDLAQEAMLGLSLVAPDSGQMHQAMAHELSRERDNQGVITNLRAALKADPNLPGVHFELAQALHNSTQPAQKAEAEGEFQLALAQSPKDDKVLTSLGDLLADKGDHAAAIARYQQALALQPANADAAVGMAHELVETGQPDAALPLLLGVETADPTNILAHYRLSAVYRRLHRAEDAKREVAEYERLKGEKEKLRSIYEAMRMDAPQATDAKQ